MKWSHAQHLIVLTSLYHLGLLGLEIQDIGYIRDCMESIGELNNCIVAYMIAEVQMMKEWEFVITDLVKLAQDSENEAKMWQEFKQGYEGNTERIFAICKLR